MLDDEQLLRSYASEGSQTAFGELVARHVNLVYSAALRRTGGDEQLAQDVAQLVFTDLARKAHSLSRNVVLPGWLHRATRFAAAQLVRTERRRQAREREAVAMNALESDPIPDWAEIRPLLDDALDELGDADRDAVILRFFEQQSLAQVGRALGANDDAARKRVSRALEKLREALVRRGIGTTGATLSAAISTHAVTVAPAGLASAITGASLTAASAGGVSTLTLLKLLTMTKLKAGLVSAVVIVSVAIPLALRHQTQNRLHERDQLLQQQADQLAQLKAEAQADRAVRLVVDHPSPRAVDDLQRLRREVQALRTRAQPVALLQEENRRLRATLAPQELLQAMRNVGERKKFGQACALGLRMYADDNGGLLPSDFAAIRQFLPTHSGARTNLTTNLLEIVAQGSLSKLKNPENVILFREKQPVQAPDGRWTRVYGFADGHVEAPTQSENSFEAWESERLAVPAAAKP